jgi:hypothetical protein
MLKEVKTSEQLIYFMRHNIRLSRYDGKFLDNLEVFASEKNRVTTNQVGLFHRIIAKYERQFAKLEAHVSLLVQLPWVATVIPSVSAYTDAFISIDGDQLIFKGPYNKTFINAIRNADGNRFIWDKETRQYNAPFSTYNLKILFDLSCNYYETVNACEISTKLINQLSIYEHIKYWSPTLVRINGNLYIVGANQYVMDAIKDIDLNTELPTLSNLARYGITISDELILEISNADTVEKVNFAASFNPILELNTSEMMVPWLVELGCDHVYLSASSKMTKFTHENLLNALKEVKIPVYDLDNPSKNSLSKNNLNYPVIIRLRSTVSQFNEPNKVAKIVQLVNSQPVDLKLKK